MSQETRIASISGELLYFRCPYQSKVMKTLEAVSHRIVYENRRYRGKNDGMRNLLMDFKVRKS